MCFGGVLWVCKTLGFCVGGEQKVSVCWECARQTLRLCVCRQDDKKCMLGGVAVRDTWVVCGDTKSVLVCVCATLRLFWRG